MRDLEREKVLRHHLTLLPSQSCLSPLSPASLRPQTSPDLSIGRILGFPLNIFDFGLSLPISFTLKPSKYFREETSTLFCAPAQTRSSGQDRGTGGSAPALGFSALSVCWASFQASWPIGSTLLGQLLPPATRPFPLLSRLSSTIMSPRGATEGWKLPKLRALSNSNFLSQVGSYIECG